MNAAKLSYSLLLIFFVSVSPLFAQQAIQGRVTDQQTRQPLPGVNITIPNTTTGTSTDRDGYFKLSSIKDTVRIKVSFIGYISQTFPVHEDQEFLNILMKPDNIALNEVRVIGFDTNKKLQETAASVALITSKEFERGNQVSLQSALNTVPGVRMDQSNLSDARIAIRGAGIRSNFGTRNIKIYVNEIPLTEADGFTRIEGLDVSAVGRAEIIKGPASSIYGAGTGGVINFQLEKAPYGQSSIEASGLAGSYGLSRLATTYHTGSDNFNASVTVGSQTYDGYREHNEDQRRFFTGSFQFFPSRKQSLTLLVNRSRQETLIPGAINANQLAENPRQANPGNLAQQAGRFQSWTRIGAAHTFDFSNKIKNTTSVYTSFYDLDHPLPFAYLRQPYQSYGGRTRFVFNPDLNLLPTTFTIGGEFLNGLTDAQRFVNNAGTEGDLTLNQELDNTQYSIFYQSETYLTDKTTLIVGLSLNKVRYKVTDFMNEAASGVKEFDAELTPRLALTHVFSEHIALRAGASFGFSPPTTSEITDADGRIRGQVQAERGINYEIGARGNLLGGGFNYDVTLFSFQMEDQLVPQAVGQNNTIYNNAGETSLRGLEAAISYSWTNESSFINSLRPFISYAYSDFVFDEFQILGPDGEVRSDFSGNDVTGISPHVITAGLDLNTAPGFYLNTTWYFNDKAPITDDNTVYNQAYSLVNTKLGYETKIGDHFKVDLYGGINNLLDEQYTSHVALNASSFGNAPPAFFNPAPRRNLYGGISLAYIF